MADKINIKNILNIDIVNKLLLFFSEITNMGISILDSNLNKIKYSRARCEFCHKISKTHWRKCHTSDKRGCEFAAKFKRPYIYKCFAGLTEITIPIFYNDDIIGFIITGQVLNNKKQKINKQYLIKIKDKENIKDLINTIPVIEYKVIKDMAYILFLVINFILDKRAYLVLDDFKKNKENYNIKIEQAKKFIEEKYFENIKLENVAQSVSLSSCYFSKLFKKITGYDYQQYLILTRLSKSKELLKDFNLKITEVAFNVGFNDSNYFSYLFKKTYKTTPKQFREKVLREE